MMQKHGREGQQLGNYRLLHLLDEGGSAEIYLAEHIHLSGQYAIKVLIGASLQDEKHDEFLLEARTIANLQHYNAHIVEIRDFGIQPGVHGSYEEVPYLVMEYARAGTLRHHYPAGTKVPLERIVFYINQVAEALQCAHDQNPPVVHRDIKPENMLLRNPDFVLLSDFGIAVTGKTGDLSIPVKSPLMGTATYIAPERFSRQELPRRASDQYSLAVVVYEWLCGIPPFDGSAEEICLKHLTMEPPALYPTYAHVTPEIEDVVMRALSKKPDDRYPTVRDFAWALEDAIEVALGQNGPSQHPTLPAPLLPTQVAPVAPQGQVIPSAQFSLSPPSMPSLPLKPPQQIVNLAQQRPLSSMTTESTLPSPMPQLILPSPTQQPAKAKKRPLERRVRDFFSFSPQFASMHTFSFFRTLGMILNFFSAFIIGLTLWNSNAPVALISVVACMVFSILCFMLCIRAVEEVVAMFFGTLLALYWGGVGWFAGGTLAPLLYLDRSYLKVFTGMIFFAISFGLHYWYVSRKNA